MHCTWGGSKTNIIHRLKTFVVGYNNSLQFNNWTTDLGVCRWENSFIFAIVVGFWTPGHQGTRKVVWWVHLGKEQGWCGWVGGHCLHLGPTKRGWVAPLVATHLSWGMEIPAALLVLTSFLGKTIRYLFTRSEKVTVGFDLLIQLGSHPRTLSVSLSQSMRSSRPTLLLSFCAIRSIFGRRSHSYLHASLRSGPIGDVEQLGKPLPIADSFFSAPRGHLFVSNRKWNWEGRGCTMAQNPLNPHQRQIDSNSCRFLQVMKLANRHETLEAHSLFSVNVSTVQTVMSASKLLRLGYP